MNIVVKSRFNPFTYEELVKPLEDYTKAYNEVAAQYDTLAAQTEAFRDIASRETNPEAYAMFSGYANDLETVLDDFSKGMTINNRSQLMGLKRRYAKEIAPIARAEAARQETEKYRRDIKAKDNSVEFKTENFSLDSFLHGRTVNNDYISGKDVLARSSAKAEALGRTLFTDPEFRDFLEGQQYQIYQQNGITPEMLGMVINDQLNNPNISESLRTKLQGFRQIIDDEMTAVSDWGDSAKQRVYNNAVTGIYAGLAKPTYEYAKNANYISPLQQSSLDLEQSRYNLSKQQYEFAKEKFDKETGAAPFYTSPDGKVKYYTNGTHTWEEVQKEDGSVDVTKPVPLKKPTNTDAKLPGEQLPSLYWKADNDTATNINSTSSSSKKDITDAEIVVSPTSLGPAHQNLLRSRLAASGTGWTLDNIQVGIIRHKFKDDEYFIIPNTDQKSNTNVTSTDTEDEDSSSAGL